MPGEVFPVCVYVWINVDWEIVYESKTWHPWVIINYKYIYVITQMKQL